MSVENDYIRLVRLILAGHHEAYGELYEKTVPNVYRTVRFLVRDAADAEDLVQEIYIQAYRSLARYDTGRAFGPWLMGVSMRQIKSYRRRKRMQFQFKQRIEQMNTDTCTEVDFSSGLIHRLANRHLLEQVQRLPYKLQQVVTLHYLNEYTQEEVADILKISLGTVKSRIHAALTKLRHRQQRYSELARKVDHANEIG
ncbi:sigma-70 family RNA polymerase sigma factor [Paenibacillus barcinonensis]|uniref:RNA polymerase sigma-70 factor (ECF subfamily) n=1 Tax=Paenibacillus barcinonensis TaxID=198119 RepID=A0A2V4VLQ1_PAEBA|nr:sigma-70 family RNA polymerase sigma factor [Paenibacillus barcinonensis]PYE43218.1 RNA polymerase sigma-70 factor (ECF subfamily) [Paenibacillus barcinonensis]QKS57029.1 sigma-70 family RNA polymerase sigma factor [Paenibacillus barcinonensis]